MLNKPVSETSRPTPRDLLDGLFKQAGFRQKSGVWVSDQGDVLWLASITRSRFGPIFFLDIGVLMKGLASGPIKRQMYLLWHVSLRANHLCENKAEVSAALSSDSGLSEWDRIRILESLVTVALAWFNQFPTEESVIAYINGSHPPHVSVHVTARDYAARQ